MSFTNKKEVFLEFFDHVHVATIRAGLARCRPVQIFQLFRYAIIPPAEISREFVNSNNNAGPDNSTHAELHLHPEHDIGAGRLPD
jgi:hypothetical protein